MLKTFNSEIKSRTVTSIIFVMQRHASNSLARMQKEHLIIIFKHLDLAVEFVSIFKI